MFQPFFKRHAGNFLGLSEKSASSLAATENEVAGLVLLAKQIVDMNSTSDQGVLLLGGTKFIVIDLILTNASVNLSGVQNAGLFTAAARGGLQLFTSGPTGCPTYNATPDGVFMGNYAGSMYPGGGEKQVGPNLFFNVATPQGAPAMAELTVYGYIKQ